MILTEDDLQQVLRRRSLQRERLLPREGDRTPTMARWITAVMAGFVISMTMIAMWHGGI